MKRQLRVLCALLLLVCIFASLLLPGSANESVGLSGGPELPTQVLSNLLPIVTSGSLDLFSDAYLSHSNTVDEALPGKEYRVLFDKTLRLEELVKNTSAHSFPSHQLITLLAEQVQKETRGELICRFAQRFLGYRYIFGAQDPSYGFDCSGLVYYVYRQFGYKINRGATGQLANGRYVKRSELQPGDLVFFGSGSYAFHVGIYLGDGDFIHAATSRLGVIISNLSESYFNRNYLTARRIIE